MLNPDYDIEEYRSQYERPEKKKIHFITSHFVSVLDIIGLSDRQAMRVFSEVAKALGHDINDLVLSRRTIQRARATNRQESAKRIIDTFEVI